ncbi:MAG: alpha-amylase family glycosyl hydrolase, partial [Chloroflexota bacterium]
MHHKIFIISIVALSLIGCQTTFDSWLRNAIDPSVVASSPAQAESAVSDPGFGLPWWNDAVFYEIFVRSFQDSDGDGKGDLQGLISRLDYLNDGDPTTNTDLGITGIWLMPVSESPSYHGYDVIDYRQVERDYGSNDDFKQLMAEAHKRGIKVIIDLVTNHTSNNHPWFREGQKPGSDFENYYIWAAERPDYRGPWGQVVWHRARERYYYGVFWQGLPDLNYDNPVVTTEMTDIARFWLEDMGVDGFRLDAIKHLIEDGRTQENTDATHTWLKGFHRDIKQIKPDALMVGEVWSPTNQILPYIGDEVDIAFEFDLADAILSSVRGQSKRNIERTLKQVWNAYPTGQYATFLTNHDQNRTMSQLQNDVGAAKAAASILLTVPGVPFIYYGEEIGMVGNKPDERIRTPMQWSAIEGTAGFTTGKPWQRLSSTYQDVNVTAQNDDAASLLNHYRSLIQVRNAHRAMRFGDFVPIQTDHRSVYSFMRHLPQESILIVVNLSEKPISTYTLTLERSDLTAINQATVRFGQT